MALDIYFIILIIITSTLNWTYIGGTISTKEWKRMFAGTVIPNLVLGVSDYDVKETIDRRMPITPE